MESALHRSRPLAAICRSGSSLAVPSDGSDFEFNYWEISSDEPPASPKLNSFSSSSESSIHSSASRLLYAAVSQEQPSYACGVADASSVKARHIHDDTDYANCDRDLLADGACGDGAGRTSVDAIKMTPIEEASSGSLLVENKNVYHLPLVASTRNRIVSEKTANSSFRSSRHSSSASLPSSASAPPHSDAPREKKRNSWSFSLDFLHSKPVCPSDGLYDCHHAVRRADEKIDNLNCHKAIITNTLHNGRYDSPQKSPFRSSASSILRSKVAIQRKKDLIASTASEETGQSASSRRLAGTLVSPVIPPPRTGDAGYPLVVPHSAGYGHSPRAATPRMNAPSSPHAQHYERQRARSQQLSRKTFLPYRQNLLGPCFFPTTAIVPSC